MWGRDGERERERERDRQTERERGRGRERDKDREIDGEGGRKGGRELCLYQWHTSFIQHTKALSTCTCSWPDLSSRGHAPQAYVGWHNKPGANGMTLSIRAISTDPTWPTPSPFTDTAMTWKWPTHLGLLHFPRSPFITNPPLSLTTLASLNWNLSWSMHLTWWLYW